jgi:hypothetical protein
VVDWVPLSILAAGSGKQVNSRRLTMPTLTIEYQDEAERLALEQLIAYYAQLRETALTAPEGTVLAACEQHALGDGRAVLRSTLAAAVQSRVDVAEQKGGPPAAVRKRTPDGPRARTRVPS